MGSFKFYTIRNSEVYDADKEGEPRGVYTGYAKLNAQQKELLEQLPDDGCWLVIRRGRKVKMEDLSAMTAQENVEFALFEKDGVQLIARGDKRTIRISADMLEKMSHLGYEWTGHTHVGLNLMSSDGDKRVLSLFEQKESYVYNAKGERDSFVNPRYAQKRR